MGRDGKPTRNKILKESKALIYENGFAGTSIDLILDRAGITKGAFFYHFKTKSDLALEMMREFVRADLEVLDQALEQTRPYEDQPRERLLNFVQFFIDLFSGIDEPPSCLYASVSNEQNQYNEEIKRLVSETMIQWRVIMQEMIDEAVASNPPKNPVDSVALADQLNIVIEGGFIVSKAINDPTIIAKQLQLMKEYYELLFSNS